MELVLIIGLAYATLVVVIVALCRAAAVGDTALRTSAHRRGRFTRLAPSRRGGDGASAATPRRQRAV